MIGSIVLDLAGLEQHVADRDEQRALVDRVDDRAVVLADDDLEVRLRLVEVAHGGEVARARRRSCCARVDREERREHDGLGDGDVLVHHRRAGAPPMMRPTWSPTVIGIVHQPSPHERMPALLPRARVLGEPLLRLRRHRGERVVDQVRRVLEDRELGAVVEEVAHREKCRPRSRGSSRSGDGSADAPGSLVGTLDGLD